MSMVVQTVGLGKHYKNRLALEGIQLSIAAGEVVGFIGPNGAGKTTLIAILAGLMRPSAGTVTMDPATRVGIVSDRCGFISHLSGRKNLELLAAIQGPEAAPKIPACLTAVKLDPDDKRPVKAYSLGMRQRLMIAQALLVDPQLLLLDEPTNGLDPDGIILLRNLLTELSGRGVAILLASHLLTEIEKLCRRVLFVNRGKVVREMDLDAPTTPEIRIIFQSRSEYEKFAALGSYPFTEVDGARPELPEVRLREQTDVMAVMARLLAEEIAVEAIGRQRPALEEAFLELLSA